MTTLPPLSSPWVFDASRDPPVYTRPLVGSEVVMQRLADAADGLSESCVGADFTSSLKVEDLKDRARKAVDKLRFVCPIIACTIEDVVSPRWVYTPSADREAWLNLAFVVEERGVSLNSAEFGQSMILKRLPYKDGNGTTVFLRIYLLTTSEESDNGAKKYGLYIHLAHSISDAAPALRALNLLCEWISGDGIDVRIEPSEEWKNLAVDPITATGGPSEQWETAGIGVLQEFAEQRARTVPRPNVPPPSRPLNEFHLPFCYNITASESETAAIIAKTKELRISVSTLFHAAFCFAQISMNPIREGTEIDFPSDSASVSIERYVKPPVDPKTYVISSLTAMPLRFPMSRVMMERNERDRLIMTAKTLQERFDRHLANPCLPHLAVADNAVLVAQSAPQTNDAEPGIAWGVFFQNMDVVDKRLRTKHRMISVDNICNRTRLANNIVVHLWTIHSKFHFQVQGSTAWEEEQLKMLVEETRRIGLLLLDDATDTDSKA